MLYEVITIKFVYRDYPRADRGIGVDAAVAARCAGAQGRYWAMHDQLFSVGGRLDSGAFISFAKSIGLDRITSYNVCYTKLLRNRLTNSCWSRSESVDQGAPSARFAISS